MTDLVISVGGSVLCPDTFDADYARQLAHVVKNYSGRVILVTGGGKTARNYIGALKSLVTDKDVLDRVGIMATHMNATALSAVFHAEGVSHDFFPNKWPDEMKTNILIAAGEDVGHSTDFDTVLLAEKYNITEMVNISNTDGVYTADPTHHADATKYDSLSWSKLKDIVGETFSSGMHAPFDPKATQRAFENNTLSCWFVDKDVQHIHNILHNLPVSGTRIIPHNHD